MKLSQLKERNMRSIFREKSYAKCACVETSPTPFSEKLELSISLDQ